MKDLPCKECRGQCCTFPVFSIDEFNKARAFKPLPQGTIWQHTQHVQCYDDKQNGNIAIVVHMKDGTCPYLVDGACSIYSVRPQTCRDYGKVKDLPCQYLYPEKAKQITETRILQSLLRS